MHEIDRAILGMRDANEEVTVEPGARGSLHRIRGPSNVQETHGGADRIWVVVKN